MQQDAAPTDSISVMHKRTELYDQHVALGARMTGFAGYHMPVQYTGIRAEHMAVRQAAGLFDVSHMGEVFVMGPHAHAFVQNLVTNDINRLTNGRALYTVMCNESGGIIDDLLVYRLREDAYMLVINAANIASDYAWMESSNPMGALLHNTSDFIALLALQGPHALSIMQAVTDIPVQDIPYYHFVRPDPGTFFGCDKAIISRTGYTGEAGVEIYVEREAAPRVWDAIMEAGRPHGLQPAGLGARDTLRLEAGYCLYGNELSEQTNPYEARLGWVTKLAKGPFIGHAALKEVKKQRPARLLVGLVLEQRGIPRSGYAILDSKGNAVGTVTSGSLSPVLAKGIALGYVANDKAYTAPGTMLNIDLRGKAVPARVVKPPFTSG